MRCSGEAPELLAGQKGRSDLHAIGPKRQRGRDAPAIDNASGSNDRNPDGVPHLRYQRERADEKIFRWREEGNPVPARVSAGSQHNVNSSGLNSARFFRRGRISDRDNAPRATCIDDLRRRYAEYKAEDRRRGFNQCLDLPLEVLAKTIWIFRRIEPQHGIMRLHSVDMMLESRTIEFGQCWIGVVDPEINSERKAGALANAGDKFPDLPGLINMSAERPEPAKIGHRRRQLNRRLSTAKRALDDRIDYFQQPGRIGLTPHALHRGDLI